MPRIVLKEQETDKATEVALTDATVGRDPACSFFIQGPTARVVSGRHARIFYQDNEWWIEDTSRNGTILDDERLQSGQRHAVKVGQVIGLGESGPRYFVVALDARKVSETVMEVRDAPSAASSGAPPEITAPRPNAAASQRPPAPPPTRPNVVEVGTAAVRPEAIRAARKPEEATEPMSPSPDWLVHAVLRATSTNQPYEVRAQVVKLGRSPECNVQIPPELGASVSRVHAEISIHDGGVTLRDMGSRNGTFVNGRRVEVLLQVAKNDMIMLGSGGPTLVIEDLHIVKSIPSRVQAPPAGGGVGTSGSGGAASEAAPPPAAAPPPPARNSFAGSPALSRHTSYRSEPPTAPSPRSRRSPLTEGALFSKNVLEDVPAKSARRVRIFIWAGVVALLAIAGLLLR